MLSINVPVAGPMPVSLHTASSEVTIVGVDGLSEGSEAVDNLLNASAVWVWTADASFLRTMAGRKGRE